VVITGVCPVFKSQKKDENEWVQKCLQKKDENKWVQKSQKKEMKMNGFKNFQK
jgi:hypothetical protein